jgi:two-component system sensor histidine kinase DesK
MSQPEPDGPQQRDPWDRYGWVMGAVWLLFLGFPLTGIAFGELATSTKVAAITCVVLFAATYVVGLVKMHEGGDDWGGPTGTGVRFVLALVVLTVVAASLAGETALGMTPFVVAFAMFALPLRAGITFAVVAMGVVLVLPWIAESFSHSWYVVPVLLTVALSGLAVRMLEARGAAHRLLTDEISMAAERDRVARDVHDVLGHSLTVITVKAELAERLVELDPVRARAELAEIQSITRQSLAEIRATVAGLRVTRLTEEIEAAASALAGAGIEAHLPADPGVVDPRHRIVLAWAIREAVTNVVRHSHAGRCKVTLGEDWLEVADDGRGLGGRKEGNGLRGLRERVHGAGGTVAVGAPASGAGTALRVQL